MSFWAPVLYATEEGRQLQSLGEAFVGVRDSALPGYMQAVMRLLGLRGGGHGRRGGGGGKS